jgi:glucose/arabinose dehydrogenase
MRHTLCRLLLALTLLPTFGGAAAEAGTTPLTARRIAFGVSRPVMVAAPTGDYERLFIVQQQGIIRVYDMVGGNLLPTPFLNIDALVGGGTSGGDERGLLGLAFHPDFATNGHFFVSYNNNSGTSIIARYTVDATNPNVANPSSAVTILTQSQPFTNHNGGGIHFGPLDGYLYIGFGDGGSANDPQGNGQNQNSRLGKMLRIDVDGGTPFAIPPTNPFVGAGAPLDEIWASGLRNPWRWSFDRETGDMWIADVGQFSVEEVNFQPASSPGGENYGWRCMEGNSCTGLSGCACNAAALTDPIRTYTHGQGCSITGGFVYRGCSMPDMHGIYFYADYCSNQIWSFKYDGATVTEFTTRTAELDPTGPLAIGSISGFGEDAYGELYICDLFGGEVFKIVPADIDSRDCDGNLVDDVCEIAVGAVFDCNGNGLSDICDISSGTASDCNSNGVVDDCEIPENDCNQNGQHDACETATGATPDCNADLIPDSCQVAVEDCNQNGVIDSCDIAAGTEQDCDLDGVPDSCQLAAGGQDCNANGVLDACDISAGAAIDCDLDGVPDSCQLAAGTATDCNGNTILDICEITAGIAADCDADGQIDPCQIAADPAADCNGNNQLDSCEIASGSAPDADQNGVIDSCEASGFLRSDCNGDGGADLADAIYTLGYLFSGSPAVLSCESACDSNDTGGLDLSDAIYTLGSLFSGGPPPPAPYPACGPETTPDSLTCVQSGCP